MASIISAGTTSGTSLNLSGDTSGVLQLATNGSTTAVTIDTSQNVGIGTASPSDKLQVTGGYARIDNSGSSALRLYNSTTQVAGIGLQGWSGLGSANDLTVGTVSSNNTIFMTGLTERMRIDSSGKVGIGTTTMTNLLNVAGAIQSSSTLVAVDANTVALSQESGYARLAAFGPNASTGGTLYLYSISSNGSVQNGAVIDSSGNVGIGTSSPDGKLKVVASGANLIIGFSGTQNYFDASENIFRNFAGTERMRIDSSGNLIMASNAGYLGLPTNQTMRVPSTGGIGYVGNINSATVFQIAYNSTSAGVQLSSGATSWGTFSDSRLKNITGTYTNALNDITQIQPVKFTWKSDENSKPQVGVIAQSVENVVPEAVDSTTIEMDGTEKYLTVRYTELIPLMIASIQELKAELDATKAEVAALKGVN